MINIKKLIFMLSTAFSSLLKSAQSGDTPSYTLRPYHQQRDMHYIRGILHESSTSTMGESSQKRFQAHDLAPEPDTPKNNVEAILTALNPTNTIVALNSQCTARQRWGDKKEFHHDSNIKTVAFIYWNSQKSEIIYLVVSKNCQRKQRKQLKSALISGVLQHQQQQGCSHVKATIRSKKATCKFYRRLGFRVNENEIFNYTNLGKIDVTTVKQFKALWTRITNHGMRAYYMAQPNRCRFQRIMSQFLSGTLKLSEEEFLHIKQIAIEQPLGKELVTQDPKATSYTAIFDDLQSRDTPIIEGNIIFDTSPTSFLDPASVRSDSDLTEAEPDTCAALSLPSTHIQKACQVLALGGTAISFACSQGYAPRWFQQRYQWVYGATAALGIISYVAPKIMQANDSRDE